MVLSTDNCLAHLSHLHGAYCIYMYTVPYTVVQSNYRDVLNVVYMYMYVPLCAGDCPRVITLILATNIITNLVNYEVGGTYYYAGE